MTKLNYGRVVEYLGEEWTVFCDEEYLSGCVTVYRSEGPESYLPNWLQVAQLEVWGCPLPLDREPGILADWLEDHPEQWTEAVNPELVLTRLRECDRELRGVS